MSAPRVAAARPSPRLRALRRPRLPRLSRRTALAVSTLAAFPVLLLSPVGHGAAEPATTEIAWHETIRGECPREPRAGEAGGCRSRWELGPVTRTVSRERSFFVLRSEQALLRVAFSVSHEGNGACSVPWIDHRTFDRSVPPVCLGVCPPRIEVASLAGDAGPLIDADGVAAARREIACGERESGAWTFDVTGLSGPLVLRYPAFGEVDLPS